jgi:hypothetical protein
MSDQYRSVKYDVVGRVAYHGGRETASVSVGSSAKGRGSSKDWLFEKRKSKMPGLSGTASGISSSSKSGSPLGRNRWS